MLKLGSTPLKFISPSTVGAKPPERFGHSLHLIKSTSILVVYGGRNDSLYDVFGNFYKKFSFKKLIFFSQNNFY